MKQAPKYILPDGTKILTNDALEDTGGLLIASTHERARCPSAEGTIRGVVGGHGGDVYWVEHSGTPPLAAYCWSEFEVVS
jgi:hypothetical protein